MKNRFHLLLSQMRRCCEHYEMIREGDRVLCAVSGGGDSLSMACGLKVLSAFYPRKFTVAAVTVDPGFGGDISRVLDFLKRRDIECEVIKADIAPAVKGLDSPCSLCARMRRAALCGYAAEHGFDALALGHTEDDAAETALMNLLYGGRLEALDPVFEYEDKNVRIIRPLLFSNERFIKQLCADLKFPVMKNPCGRDNDSARADVRKILKHTDKVCRGSAYRVAKAFYGDR